MAVNQNIEVYIDKLVLKGFAANQHEQISNAVQAEFTRLFLVNGVPGSLHADSYKPVIKAKSINVTKNAKGGVIGNKIAGSVYKGFRNEKHNF